MPEMIQMLKSFSTLKKVAAFKNVDMLKTITFLKTLFCWIILSFLLYVTQQQTPAGMEAGVL